MPAYSKNEAREWALAHMRGLDCVTIPTFTQDLKGLHRAGIQHDVRKAIEFGFDGTLLVADIAFSVDEYVDFAAWAHEAAGEKLRLVHHAAFNTLEENIEAAQRVAPYCDYTLLCYPANFYPQSEQEVYDYTRTFCEATDLGVMLFPVPLWNFGRLHQSQMSPELLRRLVDDCPSVVAIKAEGNLPGIGGLMDVYRQFKDVVVSCPLESDLIPLLAEVPFQYSGTSNTDIYGPTVPTMWRLATGGKMDEAMDLYWKINPARRANTAINAHTPLTSFINRMMWKFQGWTMGLNGGPLRQPTLRIQDAQVAQWRKAIADAGIGLPPEPTADFFKGRTA
jgi:4-hydroxy-tetrahydrodipicolinate synthase